VNKMWRFVSLYTILHYPAEHCDYFSHFYIVRGRLGGHEANKDYSKLASRSSLDLIILFASCVINL